METLKCNLIRRPAETKKKRQVQASMTIDTVIIWLGQKHHLEQDRAGLQMHGSIKTA